MDVNPGNAWRPRKAFTWRPCVVTEVNAPLSLGQSLPALACSANRPVQRTQDRNRSLMDASDGP